MKKELSILSFLTILVGFLLVACDTFNESTPVPIPTSTPRPTSTPKPTPEPIDLLGSVSEDLAEANANADTPEILLADFIEQLKSALRAQDWANIPLTENIVHGVRPFEAQSVSAAQAPQLLATGYLIDGDLIRFNIPVPNNVDTAAYYQGSDPLVLQLASTGWGVDGRASSVLYIVDQGESDFAVAGVLLDYSEFESTPTLTEATQPRGTIIQQGNTVSQVDPAGLAKDLFTHDGLYVINPTVERTLLFGDSDTTLTLLEFATGEQQSIGLDGLRLAQRTAYWLTDSVVVLGVWNDREDEGPNAGHPALLDTTTGALTLIDETNKMTSPPAVANGRVVYSAMEPRPALYVWENGTLQSLSADTLIRLGATPNDSSAFSPAISPEGRTVWWIKQNDSEQLSLVLDDPNSSEALLSATLPQAGGLPNAPIWQPNGSWLAVDIGSRFPWESGTWLVNTVAPFQRFPLGIGSSNPVWIGGDVLIYHQLVDGRSEVHQFNVVTQQTLRLLVEDDSRAVGFEPVSLSLSISAEQIPYMRRGVPPAFFVADGWEVLTLDLYNLRIQRGSARIDLRAAPRGIYLCVLEDGCDERSEEDQHLSDNDFFSRGLNQIIRSHSVFDGERLDRILFTDLDNHSDIKAYGFDVRVTLEALNDYSLTDDDVAGATAILKSLWIKSDRNSGQQIFTVENEADLWQQTEYSSPSQVWGATAYVFNPVEPEAYESNRFAGGKHRQVFVLQRRIGNQTWRVRDEVDNWGLGVGNYQPLQWLDDSLLFTYRAIPDGGGCTPFAQNSGLWRINLNNGSHAQLMPDHGVYAFTEDVSTVAVSTSAGFDLINLDSRAKQSYSFSDELDLHIQQMYFVPTRNAIMLQMYVDPPACQAINQLLVHVDLETSVATFQIEHFGSPLMLERWTGNNDAALFMDTDGQRWRLDLRTGELSKP